MRIKDAPTLSFFLPPAAEGEVTPFFFFFFSKRSEGPFQFYFLEAGGGGLELDFLFFFFFSFSFRRAVETNDKSVTTPLSFFSGRAERDADQGSSTKPAVLPPKARTTEEESSVTSFFRPPECQPDVAPYSFLCVDIHLLPPALAPRHLFFLFPLFSFDRAVPCDEATFTHLSFFFSSPTVSMQTRN